MKDVTSWTYNTLERNEKCMENLIRKREKTDG
jgi:hypothetical protein